MPHIYTKHPKWLLHFPGKLPLKTAKGLAETRSGSALQTAPIWASRNERRVQIQIKTKMAAILWPDFEGQFVNLFPYNLVRTARVKWKPYWWESLTLSRSRKKNPMWIRSDLPSRRVPFLEATLVTLVCWKWPILKTDRKIFLAGKLRGKKRQLSCLRRQICLGLSDVEFPQLSNAGNRLKLYPELQKLSPIKRVSKFVSSRFKT